MCVLLFCTSPLTGGHGCVMLTDITAANVYNMFHQACKKDLKDLIQMVLNRGLNMGFLQKGKCCHRCVLTMVKKRRINC